MKKIFVFFFLLSIFIACKHSPKNENLKSTSQDLLKEQEPSPAPFDKSLKRLATDTSGLPQQVSAGNTSAHNDWDKKIIKTA
ncbi:MAG: hypothetical protein ABJA71_06665, partial [Ginsengibacter sp.]